MDSSTPSAAVRSTDREAIVHGVAALRIGDVAFEQVHPVQRIEENALRSFVQREREAARFAFGDHMVQHMRLEQEVTAVPLRLPGLQSSFVHLQHVLGIDDDLGPPGAMLRPASEIERLPPNTTPHRLMEESGKFAVSVDSVM